MNAITPTRERTTADLPVIRAMAESYGLDASAFVFTFKAVAMPQPHTDPEFVACCMVAHQHGLNPLTKEIYFMKTKGGAIQPIVSVDGWLRKVNEHPQFDGMEFVDHIDAGGKMTACTVVIYRKDRKHPTRVTEYLEECKGTSEPWKKTERRMLRHRTLTQGARYAIGFAGLMDRDEFDQWQTAPTDQKQIKTVNAKPALLDLPEDEAPTEAIDEPIADPASFLAKLTEDRGYCTSVDDVAELRESNADLIGRLNAADRAKADKILEVEDA